MFTLCGYVGYACGPRGWWPRVLYGITLGETIYFFDPAGNRNEVFSGGYQTYPDFPTITWTADQLGKAIFYVDHELNERFTTVLT